MSLDESVFPALPLQTARRELYEGAENFRKIKEALEKVLAEQTEVTEELDNTPARVDVLKEKKRTILAIAADRERIVMEARQTREQATVQKVPEANILPKRMGPAEYAEYQRGLNEHRTESASRVTQPSAPPVQRRPAVQMTPVRPDQHPRRKILRS